MGLFTLLARCFYSPRKKQSLSERLAAAPLSPRRLERRRVLDAGAASAVLTPLGEASDFVQVGDSLDSPPPAAIEDNGEVENTPPDNLQIRSLDDLFENEIAELKFSFDDPDFQDTHDVEIDWGDGTPAETINLGPGERFVFTTHQYLDDNPTSTPMDVNQVQITVTDSEDKAVVDSEPIQVSNVAPTITTLNVTSPVNENDVAQLQLAFTDLGSLDTHTVEIDWGDGTAAEIINLNVGDRFLQTTHQYLDDNPTGTVSDVNQVKVTVTDDDLGSGMKTADVTVNNVDPTITTLNVTSPVNENDVAQLQLAFTDPGSLDTHTVEIDWGDGTAAEIINLNVGDRNLQTTHQYLDDNPTGTASDVNQVKVTVTDDDTGSGMKTADVTVNNIAPTITTLNVTSPVNENDVAQLQLAFTDPGSLDTHTVEIDWGDGTAAEIINLNVGDRFLQTTHQYLDDNPTGTASDVNQVKVTVTDDDTGSGMKTVDVTVNNVAPTIDSLSVTSPIDENDVAQLQLAFTDPGSLDTHTVEIDWGDGTAAEIVNLNVGDRFLQTTHQYLDDNPTLTASDTYTISVKVTDDDTGVGDSDETVLVKNVAPTVSINGAPAMSLEGTQIDLTSTVVDPGTLDSLIYAWDVIFDGNIIASGSDPTFSFTPADNGTFTVTLAVADDDLGVGDDMVMIEVTNVDVDPELNPVGDQEALEGALFEMAQMTFSDPGFTSDPAGSVETFTYDIDWGDGSPVETGKMPSSVVNGSPGVPTTGTIDDSHIYADNGEYTVKVTVHDDDDGSDSESFKVTVDNVDPTLELTDRMLEILEGETLSLPDLGTFSDPGFNSPFGLSEETFTYTIDWDDGSVETAVVPETTVDGGPIVDTTGTLADSHHYLDNDDDNIYTITVTIFDDDGGFDTQTIDVRVLNVNPSFVDVDPMSPNVIIATDVNSMGHTTLTVQFTDPGTESEFRLNDQSPFEILVDWGENPSMPGSQFVVERSLHDVPTDVITIVHEYSGPPDPLHPAADILISVKFRDDDFYTVPFVTDRGESVIETIAISNPGTGSHPIRVDTTPQVPRLQFRRVIRGDLLSEVSTTADASQQDNELRAVSTDAKATTESILELRVIDSYGIESEGVRLKAEVLNNLPELFLKLPDNHYAIYLVRIETNTERLVIEVYVRNGKVIDPSDDSEGTRDRPPTDEAVRERVQKILEKIETKPDGSADVEEMQRALESELEPGSKILIEPVTEPVDQGAMLPPGGLLPMAAGLVARRSYGTWARRVNRAVAQAGPKKWRELRRRSRKNRKNP